MQQCTQWYQDDEFQLPENMLTLAPEEIVDPPSKQSLLHFMVKIGDLRVELLSIGKGPKLLIIPGFGISGMSLIHQLTDMAQHFQLLIIHLPGSGLSDGMPDLLYPPTVAGTIKDVLDAVNVNDSIHVMAFSFGGLIAQELVKQYPQRFRTLTLGCSFTRTDSADTSEQSLEEKFRADFSHMENADQYYELYLASKCVNKSSFDYLPKASLTTYTTIPGIRDISLPTLVISGQLDAVVDCEESEIIAEHIPRSVHVRFPQGGHCVNITNPSEFNRIVQLFIEHDGLVPLRKWNELQENHEINICRNFEINNQISSEGSVG
ncbi:Pimeloyl-[acyl-carrier protein] methyl ester esterase [compost metagenome]